MKYTLSYIDVTWKRNYANKQELIKIYKDQNIQIRIISEDEDWYKYAGTYIFEAKNNEKAIAFVKKCDLGGRGNANFKLTGEDNFCWTNEDWDREE